MIAQGRGCLNCRYCEESGEELELGGDYLQTPTVKEHTQGILWNEFKRLVSNMQHSDTMKKKLFFHQN